jgi:endonuclease YncB( thermonuclease family)
MRKSAFVALGLLGLAGVIAGVALERPAAPPSPPPQSAASSEPAATASPPASAPSSASAASSDAPPPLTTQAAVQPTPPPVPDLPTVEVAQRPVHTVPDEEPPPAPKVTLFDRKGKELPASRQAMLTPPPAAPKSLAIPATFGGPAQAAGGTQLAVAGQAVRLFGVRVADPRDRCGLGPGDSRNCADVARDALAQRLKRYPIVKCHLPPGQRGDPGAVCVDNSGTDLGGFLVVEGFALADLGQSYEYLGSEGVARSFRRGLWHNR